jgi:hypothetical protein
VLVFQAPVLGLLARRLWETRDRVNAGCPPTEKELDLTMPVRIVTNSGPAFDAPWPGPRGPAHRVGVYGQTHTTPTSGGWALDSTAQGVPNGVTCGACVEDRDCRPDVGLTGIGRSSGTTRLSRPKWVAALLRAVVVTTGRSSQSPASGR